MSKLKEITCYDTHKRKLMKFSDFIESFPSLDKLYEISLVDHNGRPYVFRLVRNRTEDESGELNDAIGCEDLSVDLNDIKDIFMILTDDQRNIVMHIYYLYKNFKQNELGEVSEDNPKIILQGPAGTGKSTIINLIEKLITWDENKTSDSPSKINVLKCAFTGKAASNIDGVTLHHMLSIPLYITRSLSKKRLNTKKELLEKCIFFICDEISMVGESLMNSVNMRLQQIFENDKLYGGRFVLLVGDLYQIDPVKQKTLYPKSELWTSCEFYELTKIIRQQDEKFINALNNFRDSKMSKQDIDLLRSREIQDINQAPDSVIHLFYKNRRVDEYNTVKINKSNEKEEIVNVIDNDDWRPSNLQVKIGIRYMITHNMDVGDGLANGTTGIVKSFDYDKNGSVDVIWMEFNSKVIGKKARLEYMKNHSKPGFENWVPIQRSKVVVKFKDDPKINRTIGNMFPLRAAEAITVHKSQGQTYDDGVCIHITDDSYDKLRTDKTLQYVALTRVRRLEDLYIFGNFNFSVKNSKKFIQTENELNRLRLEKKLKLAFETFEDKNGDVIIYLNTELTFNDHHQFITTDKWYGNGSLLIFTETNTIEKDDIEIPNFEIAFRSDGETALRSGGGIICYKEPSKSVEFICSVADSENKITHLTLFLYEKYLYIISGFKGNLNDDDLESAINLFITHYIRDGKCILFIGDFNMSQKIKPSFAKIFNSTINEQSHGDIVCTRNFKINADNIGCYEYIPSSDHKPIYVKLPPKSEMIKTQSVDHEKPGISQNYKTYESIVVD